MLSSKKELLKRIDVLEACVHVLNGQIMELQSEVQTLRDAFAEKKDSFEEQEKEIRRWNEGIANIMNYSLDVAKGDKK